jgi:hypothetical protein
VGPDWVYFGRPARLDLPFAVNRDCRQSNGLAFVSLPCHDRSQKHVQRTGVAVAGIRKETIVGVAQTSFIALLALGVLALFGLSLDKGFGVFMALSGGLLLIRNAFKTSNDQSGPDPRLFGPTVVIILLGVDRLWPGYGAGIAALLMIIWVLRR